MGLLAHLRSQIGNSHILHEGEFSDNVIKAFPFEEHQTPISLHLHRTARNTDHHVTHSAVCVGVEVSSPTKPRGKFQHRPKVITTTG